jgi:S1-C subfamily serine protease
MIEAIVYAGIGFLVASLLIIRFNSGGKGVVVESVDPNELAADHGIKTGDVILDVGGKSVGT